MTGQTTFVITYRLSTIRNADCIMVFENKKIIFSDVEEYLNSSV